MNINRTVAGGGGTLPGFLSSQALEEQKQPEEALSEERKKAVVEGWCVVCELRGVRVGAGLLVFQSGTISQ